MTTTTRDKDRKSRMQAFIVTVILLAFLAMNAVFLYVYFIRPDTPTEQLPSIVAAALMALIQFVGMGLAFYIGTTFAGQGKSDTLNELALRSAPQPTPTPGPVTNSRGE